MRKVCAARMPFFLESIKFMLLGRPDLVLTLHILAIVILVRDLAHDGCRSWRYRLVGRVSIGDGRGRDEAVSGAGVSAERSSGHQQALLLMASVPGGAQDGLDAAEEAGFARLIDCSRFWAAHPGRRMRCVIGFAAGDRRAWRSRWRACGGRDRFCEEGGAFCRRRAAVFRHGRTCGELPGGCLCRLCQRLGHALIDRRLYLPKGWAENHARRAKACVPEDVAFATSRRWRVRWSRRLLDEGIPCAFVAGGRPLWIGLPVQTHAGETGTGLCAGDPLQPCLAVFWKSGGSCKPTRQHLSAILRHRPGSAFGRRRRKGTAPLRLGTPAPQWETEDGFARWLLARRSLRRPRRRRLLLRLCASRNHAGGTGCRRRIAMDDRGMLPARQRRSSVSIIAKRGPGTVGIAI